MSLLYELPTGAVGNSLAVFSMVNCMVGSGILGLPFAFAMGGWASMGLLVFTSAATAYTAIILVRSLDRVARSYASTNDGVDRSSYGFLAKESFGSAFEALINLSLFLELWGGACARILLQGANLNKLWPGFSTLTYMLICTAILLPTLFFGMRFLSYLSFVGVCSSVLLVATVIVSGVAAGPTGETVLLDLGGIPISFGVILFTFSGHAVFPNIYRAMQHKQSYGSMVMISFFIILAFYGGLAVAGYYYYGSTVNSQITLALPSGPLVNIATFSVVLNTMLSFALLLSAPIEMVEYVLGLAPTEEDEYEETPSVCTCNNIKRALVRIVLLGGNLGLACVIPNFGLLAALTGALCTMGMSFVYPCMIYVKLCHFDLDQRKRQKLGLGCFELFINFVIVAVGSTGAVSGVMSSVEQIMSPVQ